MISDSTDDRATVLRRRIAADSGPRTELMALLTAVCRVAAEELAASGVGVSVMTGAGVRGLYTASDPASEQWESLQFTLGEGPCIDAFALRRPVLVAGLAGSARGRWPLYTAAVHDSGVRAVFAFPLQIGAARLGAMDVFRHRPGPLTDAELTSALVLADLTVEVLLDWQEDSGLRENGGGVVFEIGNRAQLFQAQGMVMVQLGISLADALARMRAYAFAHDRGLDDVARDIVNGLLRLDSEPT